MDKTFGTKDPQLNYFDRAGAYLIDIKEGKLACVRTPKGYFLLGGGIEAGESHLDCIYRECLEEAGLAVTVTAPCAQQTAIVYTTVLVPFTPFNIIIAVSLESRYKSRPNQTIPLYGSHWKKLKPCMSPSKSGRYNMP